MIVKPAEGLTVFDPVTARALSPEGINAVNGDLHWTRLALDGDVIVEPDPVEPDPESLAPLADGVGAPADPPAGDLAADIASPGKIAARSSNKGDQA